jgi:type IV pilus secretin PilQ/predicted competence protein
MRGGTQMSKKFFGILFLSAVFSHALAAADAPSPKVAVVEDLSSSGADGGESSLYKETEASSPLDRKVTIRVSNVPIGTFLDSISAQAKINFITSQEYADKKLSASLSNVTVREALDTLLRMQGLTYQRVGKSNSYMITKRSNESPNMITKVYTLNYVPLENMDFAKEPKDATSPAILNGGMVVEEKFTPNAPKGGPKIGEIIKSVLSSAGQIAYDERTNKIIITDVPDVFAQIEAIIAEIDVKAPQILIEAQIIEVSKNSGYDVGFKWGLNATLSGSSTEMPWQYWAGKPNDTRKTGPGLWKYLMGPTTVDDDGNIEVQGTIPKLTIGTSEGALVMFSALMSRNEARSLGKPKLITMNNIKATIKSSQQAAIGQITNSQSLTGNVTNGVERSEVGLTLDVTPQVNKEGYVTLTVEPSYSTLKASALAGTQDPVTRSVSTQVRVKSGQTVVLGGLIQTVESDGVEKVPLLGQIPILGWLFTYKTKRKDTTDLVIFITPTILSE